MAKVKVLVFMMLESKMDNKRRRNSYSLCVLLNFANCYLCNLQPQFFFFVVAISRDIEHMASLLQLLPFALSHVHALFLFSLIFSFFYSLQ